MHMRIGDFKVLTFDVYGTLIDWESGMLEALRPLTDRVERSLTNDQILESHARNESEAQRWTPAMRYSDLLAIVYRRLGEEWGVDTSWEDCTSYGQSVGNWPAFHDSHQALAYLKSHFRLAVLTNTDQRKLRTQFGSARHLIRLRVHRRGCRFLQARPAKLRLHAFPARARRIRQIRHSSCRREPVSRPCPSASKRPRDLLDPPSLRQAGFRRNHADCDRPRIRFPFRKHGRIRRHPSSGDRCRHLNSDADSAARCGLAAARIQNFRRERRAGSTPICLVVVHESLQKNVSALVPRRRNRSQSPRATIARKLDAKIRDRRSRLRTDAISGRLGNQMLYRRA